VFKQHFIKRKISQNVLKVYVVIHIDGYTWLELNFKIPTSTTNTAWFSSNYIQGSDWSTNHYELFAMEG